MQCNVLTAHPARVIPSLVETVSVRKFGCSPGGSRVRSGRGTVTRLLRGPGGVRHLHLAGNSSQSRGTRWVRGKVSAPVPSAEPRAPCSRLPVPPRAAASTCCVGFGTRSSPGFLWGEGRRPGRPAPSWTDTASCQTWTPAGTPGTGKTLFWSSSSAGSPDYCHRFLHFRFWRSPENRFRCRSGCGCRRRRSLYRRPPRPPSRYLYRPECRHHPRPCFRGQSPGRPLARSGSRGPARCGLCWPAAAAQQPGSPAGDRTPRFPSRPWPCWRLWWGKGPSLAGRPPGERRRLGAGPEGYWLSLGSSALGGGRLVLKLEKPGFLQVEDKQTDSERKDAIEADFTPRGRVGADEALSNDYREAGGDNRKSGERESSPWGHVTLPPSPFPNPPPPYPALPA